MSLIMITEAMKLMEETDADFGMEEKEFIAQYAFRTGDTDLVKKLIEELQEKRCRQGEGTDKVYAACR